METLDSYKHVLFCMDYSDDSFSVGEKAKLIAQRNHAEFTLLHVLEEINMATGFEMMPLLIDEENDKASIKDAKIAMREMAEKLGVNNAHTHVISAFSAREGIHQAAKELGVDMIVVGSQTRHGLAMLLGSTANSTLHDAPCDVLAVKI